MDVCKLVTDLQRAARYFERTPEKFDIGMFFEDVGTFNNTRPGVASSLGVPLTPLEKLVKGGLHAIRERRRGANAETSIAFQHSLPDDAPADLPRLEQSYYKVVAHFDPKYIANVPEQYRTDAMREAHVKIAEAEAEEQRKRDEETRARERAFVAKHVDLEGFSEALWAQLTNTDPAQAWHHEGLGDDSIRTFVTKIERLAKNVQGLRTVFGGAGDIPPAIIEVVLQCRPRSDEDNALHALAVQHIDVVFQELPGLAVALLMAHNEMTGSVPVPDPRCNTTGVRSVNRRQLKATWLAAHRTACTTRAAVDYLLAEINEVELAAVWHAHDARGASGPQPAALEGNGRAQAPRARRLRAPDGTRRAPFQAPATAKAAAKIPRGAHQRD